MLPSGVSTSLRSRVEASETKAEKDDEEEGKENAGVVALGAARVGRAGRERRSERRAGKARRGVGKVEKAGRVVAERENVPFPDDVVEAVGEEKAGEESSADVRSSAQNTKLSYQENKKKKNTRYIK